MPTIARISGIQFDALPYEEGRRWELLEGEPIEVSSPTPLHQDIVFAILLALKLYLQEHRLEGAAYGDVEFALSEDVRLRPDVCLLLPDRARQLDRKRIPIPGAPNLAIEVISPSERASRRKSQEGPFLSAEWSRRGLANVPGFRHARNLQGRNQSFPDRRPAGHHRSAPRLFRALSTIFA
jgi:Uma2 family endonuclease